MLKMWNRPTLSLTVNCVNTDFNSIYFLYISNHRNDFILSLRFIELILLATHTHLIHSTNEGFLYTFIYDCKQVDKHHWKVYF